MQKARLIKILTLYLSDVSSKLFHKQKSNIVRLSTLRLAIETESIDNSKKVNLIAFQSFAKQNDISVNDSYTISRTPMAQNPAFRQDSAHFSNIEGLSPINNRQNTGRGIYIQDNSTAPTPFRGMTPAQPTRLNQEVTNTMERINMLQKKAEEYRTLSRSIFSLSIKLKNTNSRWKRSKGKLSK